MPLLTLAVSAAPDAARACALAEAVTDLTVAHLRKKRELTAVTVAFEDPAACSSGAGASPSRTLPASRSPSA